MCIRDRIEEEQSFDEDDFEIEVDEIASSSIDSNPISSQQIELGMNEVHLDEEILTQEASSGKISSEEIQSDESAFRAPTTANQENPSGASEELEERNSTSMESVENITEETAEKLLDRRMIVAYGIQLAVMRKLESDERFKAAKLENLPELLAVLTAEICEEYDFDKLLS